MFNHKTHNCIKNVASFGFYESLLNKKLLLGIPRGYRKEYIPGDSGKQSILREFEASGDPEIVDDLLRSLDENWCKKWQQTMDSLDFTHLSRKA